MCMSDSDIRLARGMRLLDNTGPASLPIAENENKLTISV